VIYKKRTEYLKTYGSKTTVIAEVFKENENKGITINDTRSELIRDDIVNGRMLDIYTTKYEKTKNQIGWI